jgi:hypothetical protein
VDADLLQNGLKQNICILGSIQIIYIIFAVLLYQFISSKNMFCFQDKHRGIFLCKKMYISLEMQLLAMGMTRSIETFPTQLLIVVLRRLLSQFCSTLLRLFFSTLHP